MKIFIVIGESGEYSDRTQWSIVATRDEEKAKIIVSHLADMDKYQSEYAKLEQKWSSIYDIEHPEPEYIERPSCSTELKRLQSIPKAFKTTKDKEDFKKLNNEHNQIIQMWQQEVAERAKQNGINYQAKLDERQKHRTGTFKYPEYLIETIRLLGWEEIPTKHLNMFSDTRYSYEELELLD